MEMQSIDTVFKAMLEIKKSKFYSFLIPWQDDKKLKETIAKIKKEYPDATHYCYAYILPSKEKESDDGEPSGTAGLPMLNVLKQNKVTNVLLVVVRYFGGIKLGAGGLIRAYNKAARMVVEQASFYPLVPGYKVEFTISYASQKEIDYLLSSYEMTKTYEENVTYRLELPQEDWKQLKPKFPNAVILEEKLIINKKITRIL